MTDERIILEATQAGISDVTIPTNEIVSYRITKTHTGMADLRATLTTDTDPTPFAQRKDFLRFEIGGSTEFIGKLVRPGKQTRTGERTIKADGVASVLEESRPDYENLPDNEVSYQSIALEDAIDNYWTRTPFANVTVVDESTEVIGQDKQIASISTQTEWSNRVSPSATDPYAVRNGSLVVEQTAFTSEGETSTSQTTSDVDYSGGSAGHITGTGSSDITIDFTTNYDIPSGSGEFYVRGERGSGSGTPATVSVFLDGNKILNDTIIVSDPLNWESVFSTSSTLSAGSHTVRIAFENAFDNVKQIFDVLAFVDNRYTYNFDNTVHQDSGYLDGPETAPAAVRVDAGTDKTQFNIGEATLDADLNDTTGGQALGIDLPVNTATAFSSNTSSATEQNSDVGREVGAEFKIGHYPQSSSPQSATPRFGYDRQQVNSYELLADLNSLAVIDDLSLRGNHFDNLQQLHDYGDYVFVIEHSDDDIADLSVTSFAAGDKTRPRPSEYDDPFEKKPQVDSSDYYNAVFLRGGEPASGPAPTATVDDAQEISNAGERIEATVKDPSITTDAGARFRAQALLNRLITEKDRTGTIEIPKTDELLPAGFARSVDFGGGTVDATLEESELRRDASGAVQTHRYAPVDDVSRELTELKRNARSNRNQV